MKKAMLVFVLALALLVQAGLAQEFEAEKQAALDAAMAQLPEAVFDYQVRERDDGGYEWDLFFTQNGQLGQCQVKEGSGQVREIRLYDMPEGALTASQAVEKLIQEKGELTVTDLELDYDDGRLRYEGEASQNGARYEFEMEVTGRVHEWERD